MAEHNELGKLGEELAVEFYKKRRLHHFSYKLDFQKPKYYCSKETILAVIEVKTRSSLEFGLPQDFVKKKYNFLPRQLTPM
jgi:putative endonuclease